jgi:uncharacterized repeat protein (TIGR02543 family)
MVFEGFYMRKLRIIVQCLLLSMLLAAPLAPAGAAAAGSQPASSEPGTLLQFTSAGHVLGFTQNAVYLAGLDHSLRVDFEGGRAVQPAATAGPVQEGGIAALGRVSYRDIWNNIDIIYSSVQGGIAESTYVVHPGGDPSAIRLRYNVPVSIEGGGGLRFSFENGYMTESAPVAWQEVGGKRREVAVRFEQRGEDLIGFAAGGYDGAYALYIDPTYAWHTFYGSADGIDYAYGIARDALGNVYVAGRSAATWNGPGATAPLNPYAGGYDIVVVKLSGVGAYAWHTFYGGAGSDYAWGIALDALGNVYVAGYSNATWNGPGSTAPLNPYAGNNDIVVVKLSGAGAYAWHTFYGSAAGSDIAYCIARDSLGNVYVAGYSNATWNGPGATAPLNPYAGGRDIVVVKLSEAGAYAWHTFYGSAGHDEAYGIALDALGNVYVAGYSNATWNGPGSTAPLNPYAGNNDIVVVKLSGAGAYAWHTFYGSAAGSDIAYCIARDSLGNVYVAGYSNATWNGPGPTAPLNPYAGSSDIVVVKLSGAGAYAWHTFYGSAAGSEIRGIALDALGNVYVAGNSSATWNGPGATAPLNPYAGANDIVVVKLSGAGTYAWHTFYGSAAGSDIAYGIVLDSGGNVYVTGFSGATWNGPGETAPLNPYAGNNDIVVVKTSDPPTYTVTFDKQSGTGGSDSVSATYGAAMPAATAPTRTGYTFGGYYTAAGGAGTQYYTAAMASARNWDIAANTTLYAHWTSSAQNTPVVGIGIPTSHGGTAASTTTTTNPPVSLPNIQIQSASLSAATVTPGTPVTVTASLGNRGAVNGNKKVTVYVNGQEEAAQGVTVNSGGSAQLAFDISRSEPGEYSVYVDGTPAGSFRVEMFRESDLVLIFSITALAAVFVIGMVMLRRRQQH